MIIVHHLNNSRSQRILWLLEELGVPYEIKYYQRGEDQRAPKELLAISPLGKSPVITDGAVNLAESGAITEYLISKYGVGKLQAPASGQGEFNKSIIFDLVPSKTPFFIRPVARLIFSNLTQMILAPEFERHFTMIEDHLSHAESGWFAGGEEPTVLSYLVPTNKLELSLRSQAADFQMAFPLEAVVASAPNLAKPKINDYVKRVHARPAYKRALEKGGAYEYARTPQEAEI
ncbi:hypothetical protein H0H92_010375 [Tricholoma furcatifolium]|nr:hypothetical protein H0H92_010375 [Tricholoma furcatifolium]